MNWQCLIQAVLAYFSCAGGFADKARQQQITDCLIRAGTAGLAAAIPEFFRCLQGNGANGNGNGNGDAPGYNPGDRKRCG